LVAATELGQSLRKTVQGLDTSRVAAAFFPRPLETIANVRILRLLQSHAQVMEITSALAAKNKSVVH
jgi:hypothetical protein